MDAVDKDIEVSAELTFRIEQMKLDGRVLLHNLILHALKRAHSYANLSKKSLANRDSYLLTTRSMTQFIFYALHQTIHPGNQFLFIPLRG